MNQINIIKRNWRNNMYVYIKSEANLWTVGFYDPDGNWHGDSDHGEKNKRRK